MLAAVAEGENNFDCVVIATSCNDQMPFPDGRAREFLRGFGEFPVILVNARLEAKHTSTQELFPHPLPASAKMTGSMPNLRTASPARSSSPSRAGVGQG